MIARPSGNAPSHDLHRSPAFGMIEPVPGTAAPPDARAMLATAGGVFGVAIIDAGGAVCRADVRGGGCGAGAAAAATGGGGGGAAVGGAGGTIVAADAWGAAPADAGRSEADELNGTAISGVPGSIAGPASSDRSAVGESAMRTLANCLNAAGSGFVEESSFLRTSRMWSSTIR